MSIYFGRKDYGAIAEQSDVEEVGGEGGRKIRGGYFVFKNGRPNKRGAFESILFFQGIKNFSKNFVYSL